MPTGIEMNELSARPGIAGALPKGKYGPSGSDLQLDKPEDMVYAYDTD